jgi:CubicO group peptidase (beta-lactamase class C family)
MTDFNATVAAKVTGDHPVLQGLIFLGIDKKGTKSTTSSSICEYSQSPGNRFYEKTFGVDKLGADAKPVTTDSMLKIASCTKLITSIAALQCVEKGLIDLDEPVSRVIPELAEPEIISWEDEAAGKFKLTKAKTPITLRHLLTHSSGLTYEGWGSSLHAAWRKSHGGVTDPSIKGKVLGLNIPLLYEPGQGWSYGTGLDFAGDLVRRLNKTTLQEYFDDNIFKAVGRSAPYPVFRVKRHPEQFSRLMSAVTRIADGKLEYNSLAGIDDPDDEFGGHGLSLTSDDYIAVLYDLISDSPKLLKPESLVALFTPQFIPGSPSYQSLNASGSLIDPYCRGDNQTAPANYGLGGLVLKDAMPEYGQPADTLTWSGVANTVWFANRNSGIAGWFATQLSPFNDEITMNTFRDFRTDLWKTAKEKGLF